MVHSEGLQDEIKKGRIRGMGIKFEIDDYYDLLNLHKALLEAKFHENPDNEYVAGSPIIARLYNNIMDLLAEHEREQKGQEAWSKWRKLSEHPDLRERIIHALMKIDKWKLLTEDEKIDKIINYSAPFECSSDEIMQIMRELDKM